LKWILITQVGIFAVGAILGFMVMQENIVTIRSKITPKYHGNSA
jgi:hypothetical protein